MLAYSKLGTCLLCIETAVVSLLHLVRSIFNLDIDQESEHGCALHRYNLLCDKEVDQMKIAKIVGLALVLSLVATYASFTRPPEEISTGGIKDGRHPLNNGVVAWHITNVDTSGTVGQYTAIALDNDGRPHISYYDYGNTDLKYAYFDGFAWHIDRVESDYDEGQYSSIAIGRGNNNPYISHYDATNNYLKFAYFNGFTWYRATIDSSGNVGEHTSIALDDDDYPHISYYKRGPDRNLMYASYDGYGWNIETARSSGDIGEYTSIDLDSNGYPYISHFDSEYNNILITYKDGSGWHTQIAPESDANFSDTETSISIDQFDQAYISYRQIPIIPSASNLICAVYTGTGWGHWDVDTSSLPFIGTASSIVVDNYTNVHIGYHGAESGLINAALKYAYYNGTWQIEVVDSYNDLGDDDVSIAVDDGYPPHVHMSYYDETRGYLRYVVRNHLPEASGVSISPPYPTDDDGLVGSYIFDDENGDPDSSRIMWYVDDVHDPSYDGVLTIPAEDASLGQEWQFSVTPYDGYGYNTIVYSNKIRINALPVASNLRFFPENPNTTDPLGARYDYYDANGDPDFSLTTWLKNGVSQPQYQNWDDLPPSATKKGEEWRFWIRPNDGIEYNQTVVSPAQTITNTVPAVSYPIIEPAPLADPSEDITADYIFSDPDYPEIDADLSQIRWYINYVLIPGYNNLRTLSNTVTMGGDSVYFTVQAYDGDDYGNTEISFTILVNNIPMASNLSLDPDYPYTTDGLTASYDFYDGDGHSDQSEINWYKNGSFEFDGLTVPMGATAKGQEWYFKVKPYDGYSYGTEQTSSTVTILNSTPVAENVRLYPQQPWTGNNLTLSYEFSDVDDDTETGTQIYWYKNDVQQSAYDNKTNVPSSATHPDEEWYLTVQVYDGEEFSTIKQSQTEIINAELPEYDAPGCFLCGTSILMADGSQKPIEDIKVGDIVLSFDENSGKMIPDRVSEIFHHPKESTYLIINGYLRVTPIHSVLSNGKWIPIGELSVGDPLTNSEGKDIDIENVIAVKELVDVYNFEVNPYHTYVAEGYVVHNRKPDKKLDIGLNSAQEKNLKGSTYYFSSENDAVVEEAPPTPNTFRLSQNYPNPFNPTTTIRFDLPKAVHVRLYVYNVHGQLIATIVDQYMAEGQKEVSWAGKDNGGLAVSCGIYFYRLIAGNFVQTKKMALLR